MTTLENWYLVRSLLDELGNTPEDIRDTLFMAGITGRRRPHMCPVARYVKRKLVPATGTLLRVESVPTQTVVCMARWRTPDGRPPGVRVGYDRTVYQPALDYTIDYLEPHAHSNALHVFILRFNNRGFPELIK